MKVISFNANGIRSAARKGFYDWSLYYPSEYHCEYFDAVKKGYSGVAIYAREKPCRVMRGIGFPYCDEEGRYIQFDYEHFSVISLYMPSGTSGDERQAVKYDFLSYFATHLETLKTDGRALIICGDYNIAHKKIDLKNWRGNQKNSGFLPQERAWLDTLFGPMGFVDAFRVKNQQEDQYTWWSNRGRARENNVGWRIDYQVITPNLADRVKQVDIYRDNRFSDHAPLCIEYTDP
jgi:exodeoxyribonuclease-3